MDGFRNCITKYYLCIYLLISHYTQHYALVVVVVAAPMTAAAAAVACVGAESTLGGKHLPENICRKINKMPEFYVT